MCVNVLTAVAAAAAAPQVAKHELTLADCYSIFKLVADKGGCKAAVQIRAWAGIARAWNAKVIAQGKNVPTNLRSAYERHLLQYENHISHGCEVRLCVSSFLVCVKADSEMGHEGCLVHAECFGHREVVVR